LKITEKDVVYVAALANLELTEHETAQFASDLDSILAYVEKLNELDTTNVEPMAQVLYEEPGKAADVARGALLRADLDRPGFSQEQSVESAPESGAGQFKVPKVIER
jgi:aspartyl-tRNA(Asn)/glutamyl-tRNA(Gln) amidotransferase subunit C